MVSETRSKSLRPAILRSLNLENRVLAFDLRVIVLAARGTRRMSDEVNFHFLKNPDCSEIIVDGAFGGLTPNGRISMAVYTERLPVPKIVVHEVKNGLLGPELIDKRQGLENYVRIIEAVLHMELSTAKTVHEWLGGRIQELEASNVAKK